MGFFDRFRSETPPQENPRSIDIAVGAKGGDVTMTFNQKNITYTGELTDYNYDT